MSSTAEEAERAELSQHGTDLEKLEIELLLEAVFRHYGFDFRSYAYASLKRRVQKRVYAEGLTTVSTLQDRVLHDPAVMERLLLDLSVNVSSMFRDPNFYKVFREKAVPLLKTYPYIRLWHAGCSTGEEVYSMAILLEEEGLYDRSRIYATDINEVVLKKAKEGIYPLDKMQEYTQNYLRAGGSRAFSEYYTAMYDGALFKPALMRNVVFAQHNLVTDRSFSEFNVILCRNVMIYFDKTLQDRVHDLFYDSLVNFGILALGSKESMKFSKHEAAYDPLDAKEKIYRRVR
jgi:chemotaxis protein methyltransferase CheR